MHVEIDEHRPVCIVGGGPVGLMLAADLGWRGVPCVLFEQRTTTSQAPKCNLVNMRTMEHFRRLGIADQVREAGVPQDWPIAVEFCTGLSGHTIYRFETTGYEEYEKYGIVPAVATLEAAEAPARISQIHTEPILKARAETFDSVDLRFGHRVEAVEQDDDGVVLTVSPVDGGQRTTVRGAVAVACDGAGSPVRKALGIGMAGGSGLQFLRAIFFESPELYARTQHRRAMMFIIVNHDFRGVLVSVDPVRGWWCFHRMLSSREGLPEECDDAATLRRLAGFAFDYDIRSVSNWRTSLLVAERFQDGRIFLAGDAAHVFTPTGGFGMNTGIGDACDLAWKFAAVHQGWAGQNLLNTYDLERRPVGHRNVYASGVNAERLTKRTPPKLISRDGWIGNAVRALAGKIIAVRTRDEFVSEGIQLGYSYAGSPIIVDDGTPAPPDRPGKYIPTARPGHRLPLIRFDEDDLLYDRLGSGFTMLAFRDAPDEKRACVAAAESIGMPLQWLTLSTQWRDRYEADFVLVRPDQHVAWRGDKLPPSLSAWLDRVRGA